MSEFVLSIEDPHDIVKQLRTAARSSRQRERVNAEACCDWLADAIEAQIPKPPEPKGLGAVVEDAEGNFWVYAGLRALKDGETREWVHAAEKRWYGDIDAVKVLSEGVTA